MSKSEAANNVLSVIGDAGSIGALALGAIVMVEVLRRRLLVMPAMAAVEAENAALRAEVDAMKERVKMFEEKILMLETTYGFHS